MPDTDIVQLIKDHCRIEVVIGKDFPLEGHGKYWSPRKGTHEGGLVVDTHNQIYHWYQRSEGGDVIDYVRNKTGCDFKQACETLCREAGLPDPVWSEASHAARMLTRAREDIFQVSADVFARWLKESAEATAYARGRGWSEDTIRASYLGYSGAGTMRPKLRDELLAALIKANADVDSAPAVAMLGFHGDVEKWGREHEVEVHPDWVEHGYIPGLMGMNMLVYPYVRAGRVVYFHGRAIADQKIQHYNPPSALVGARPLYFNPAWSRKEREGVIVEGEGDAVTLAQWGIPAVGLATNMFTQSNKDELTQETKDKHIYDALDQDKAGRTGAEEIAMLLGPMTRMLNWGEDKDANEMLKMMAITQVSADDQVKRVRQMMDESLTWVEVLAERAGKAGGAGKIEAQRVVLEQVRRMDEVTQATYQTKLSKALGLGVRDYNHILRILETPKGEEGSEDETVFTFGGLIDGWLVEYLFDPETKKSLLAWRDPNGKIATGESVMINGHKYLPEPPNNEILEEAIIFPSAVGSTKTIRELIYYIESYLTTAVILPFERMRRLIAYWILLSWVYDMFETTIYLRFMGDKGSGKSEMASRIGLLSNRTLRANGASTSASLFRMAEKYQGTVLIDESDISSSDASSDVVKFLNLGAMRGNPIWRVEKVTRGGRETFEGVSFKTFCPKILSMRKDYMDDAVGSRCLTIKVQPRETLELVTAHVPLTRIKSMKDQALAIRNLLLAWRMNTWVPNKEVPEEAYDIGIDPRLNQVSGPLIVLSENDPQQQEEIRVVLREYYRESILVRSMGLTARVIESLWKIMKSPGLKEEMVKVEPDGRLAIKIGDVSKICNLLMDEMNDRNEDDDLEEDSGSKRKKKKAKELTPRSIGFTLREELQLEISTRRREGFYVFWNEPRLVGLAMRFGVNPDDFGPDAPKQTKPLTERVEDAVTQPSLGGSQDD